MCGDAFLFLRNGVGPVCPHIVEKRIGPVPSVPHSPRRPTLPQKAREGWATPNGVPREGGPALIFSPAFVPALPVPALPVPALPSEWITRTGTFLSRYFHPTMDSAVPIENTNLELCRSCGPCIDRKTFLFRGSTIFERLRRICVRSSIAPARRNSHKPVSTAHPEIKDLSLKKRVAL